jgi:hypothetical protein
MAETPNQALDVSKEWFDTCVGVQRIANPAEAVGAWLERVGPCPVAF